jgi:hypothetical protein
MKRTSLVLLLFLTAIVINCRRHDEEYDWPVWILDVYAVEEGVDGITQPVRGCPWVHWRYENSGHWNLNHCTKDNRVKVWKHIDDSVTLIFVAGCDGYRSSPEYSVDFPMSDVRQAPGRDGPEVERRFNIFLVEQ